MHCDPNLRYDIGSVNSEKLKPGTDLDFVSTVTLTLEILPWVKWLQSSSVFINFLFDCHTSYELFGKSLQSVNRNLHFIFVIFSVVTNLIKVLDKDIDESLYYSHGGQTVAGLGVPQFYRLLVVLTSRDDEGFLRMPVDTLHVCSVTWGIKGRVFKSMTYKRSKDSDLSSKYHVLLSWTWFVSPPTVKPEGTIGLHSVILSLCHTSFPDFSWPCFHTSEWNL